MMGVSFDSIKFNDFAFRAVSEKNIKGELARVWLMNHLENNTPDDLVLQLDWLLAYYRDTILLEFLYCVFGERFEYNITLLLEGSHEPLCRLYAGRYARKERYVWMEGE